MQVSELSPAEYNDYYAGYIAKVPSPDLEDALRRSGEQLVDYLRTIPHDRIDYAYEPGKWTVKECLQHVIDTERIFAARALRIGRGDTIDMPGFDQDRHMDTAEVELRAWTDMIEEFAVLRRANRFLFASLSSVDLARVGSMSGGKTSCRAIGYIMSGHVMHHVFLYRERYE